MLHFELALNYILRLAFTIVFALFLKLVKKCEFMKKINYNIAYDVKVILVIYINL